LVEGWRDLWALAAQESALFWACGGCKARANGATWCDLQSAGLCSVRMAP